MCGRFALYMDAKTIKHTFDLEVSPDMSKRYNIAPSQEILCISDHNGHREAEYKHWGLIPFWADDKTISRHLVNARAETVATKPAFRHAFKTHRALVVMSGFYEWMREDGKKQPFYFKHADDTPLAVAALCETWQDKTNNDIIESCCLITTEANDKMRPIHDRMPVILNQTQFDVWLNHDEFHKDELTQLLRPCSNKTLITYPVSSQMNNARFEEKEAIEPKNA